jgi:hypothetical protein
MSFTSVNSGYNSTSGSTSSIGVTLTGINIGDFVFVAVGYGGTPSSISVSDGTTTFSVATGATATGGSQTNEGFFLPSSSISGSVTYTVSFGSAVGWVSISACAFTPSGPVIYDGGNGDTTGYGTDPNSGSIITTAEDGIMFGSTYTTGVSAGVSSPLINGIAADSIINNGSSWHWTWCGRYFAPTNGSASATYSAGEWKDCIGAAFKIERGPAQGTVDIPIFTDAFTQGTGTANLSTTNWRFPGNVCNWDTNSDGTISPNSVYQNRAAVKDKIFGHDQYAEVDIIVAPTTDWTDYVGVSLWNDSGSDITEQIIFRGNTHRSMLFGQSNGSNYTIGAADGGAIANGDRLRIEVIGTTVNAFVTRSGTKTLWINGKIGSIPWVRGDLDTSKQWMSPGIYASDTSGAKIDNFACGDLSPNPTQFHDDFYYSNGGSTSDGYLEASNYNNIWSGCWKIVGHSAQADPTNIYTNCNTVLGTWANDQWAQFTYMSVCTSTSTEGYGPAVRSTSDSSGDNLWLAANSTRSRIYKYTGGGGANVQIGSDGPSFAYGDIGYIEVIGDTVTAKKNGTNIISGSVSSAGGPTSGKPALMGRNAAGMYADNFYAGTIDGDLLCDDSWYEDKGPTYTEYLAPGATRIAIACFFVASQSYTLDRVDIMLSRMGSPTYDITCELWSNGTGDRPGTLLDTSTTTINALMITDYGAMFSYEGFTYSLTSGTSYHIVIRASTVGDWSNNIQWHGTDVWYPGHHVISVWDSSPVTILQKVEGVSNYGNTTRTATFASACTPGSLIVATYTDTYSDIDTYTMSDGVNSGNYDVDKREQCNFGAGTMGFATVNSKRNTSSSALTITAVNSSANCESTLSIYELSGVPDSNFIDIAVGAHSTAAGQTMSLTVGTTVNNSAIIAVQASYPGGGFSADSGYSQFTEVAGWNGYATGESREDCGTAGSNVLTFGTSANSRNWYTAAAVAYKSRRWNNSDNINTIFQTFKAATVSIYRPGSDVTTTGWVASTGGTYYSLIDEVSYDDADYITSPTVGSGSPITMGLTGSVPAGTYDVRVRVKRTGSTGQVKVHLLDSSNTDLGSSSWQTLTTSFASYTLSVTTTGTATRVRIEVQA